MLRMGMGQMGMGQMGKGNGPQGMMGGPQMGMMGKGMQAGQGEMLSEVFGDVGVPTIFKPNIQQYK